MTSFDPSPVAAAARRFAFGLMAAVGLASGAQAAPPATCHLSTVAEFPVTMLGLAPIIPAKVNGETVRFVADTGAFYSIISDREADRLKLEADREPAAIELQSGRGRTFAGLRSAHDFSLGSLELHHADFLVASDFGDQVVGVIGQNILGRLDAAEFDLANGVIRLFKTDGCGDTILAYWAQPDAPVGMLSIKPVEPLTPQIVGEAKINGQSIKVMFDTGGQVSSLQLSSAQRIGLAVGDADVKAGGAYRDSWSHRVESWLVPISSFEIGDEKIANTRLRVAKSDFGVADMLLGADFFLSHRIFVSYKQHKIYFTYNGGPVFRIEDSSGSKASAATAAAPPPASANAEHTLDADELSRRGAAELARYSPQTAIDDFTQAIVLQPTDAQHYFDRAHAYFEAGEAAKARADLDQAVKLKPNDPEYLLMRGVVRQRAGETAAADEDYRAALAAAPAGSAVTLGVAEAYAGAGKLDLALPLFEAWLAVHPGDAQGLNERCWARVLANRDLDKALDDCNRALRHGQIAAVLDSRGYVYLRRSQFDLAIADFSEALKLQPTYATSLYGRGLARLGKGDKAAAVADIAAATALRPNVAETFKRYGLDAKTAPAEPAKS
jgi:tetratricopeptide (TPR) repeat protein/predicted aspartyl protease